MKAIKFIDSAGNINYVKGDLTTGSLVKAVIGDKPYKGTVDYMFFYNYSDFQLWLSQHPNKIAIGKGCISTGLKYGNSRDNYVYQVTEVSK